MPPQLEDRGSTYEGFEVRKDRWWAFPLQLSHLLSSQHSALCFPVGDSHSLCFYIILPTQTVRIHCGINFYMFCGQILLVLSQNINNDAFCLSCL